ncbi:hypothetical protein B7494_g2568 [Chlorociboria aeruginascens]|nr:hypothetical protein B7494_g2568 [Chlorociboria aeruginascens]
MHGKSDLHRAAESGQKEAVLEAIANGEDPKVKDFLGKLPLHYAAEYGYPEIVTILIQAGSDVSAMDHGGRTAADHAALRKQNDWEKVLELIRKEEASKYEMFRAAAASEFAFVRQNLVIKLKDIGLPPLKTIWAESYIDTKCEECEGFFIVDAPIRTISLSRSKPGSHTSREPPSITIGEDTIVFHNRHLGCIRSEGTFIAVSHAWHSVVSIAHTSRISTPEAVYRVYDTPIQVLRAAAQRWGPDIEIWHDYVSVPQWSYEVQQNLLILLPLIFEWGSRTLVHLQDIPKSVVLRMQNGATCEERLRGAMSVMQSAWYSRVWTSLEMMRSSIAHLVTTENEIFATTDDLFYSKMDAIFRDAIEREGDLIAAEKLAGDFGYLPVPDYIRFPRKSNALMNSRKRHRISLGHAYDILERLQCTVPHDKFIALFGLTGLRVPGGRVERGDIEACTQLALTCLEAGDFSPLLLCRAKDEQELPQMKWLKGYKTNCGHTWQLGDQIGSASYRPIVNNGGITLKLKAVGTICFASKVGQMYLKGEKAFEAFSEIVKFSFGVTGRSEVDFIRTVGTQYYGIDAQPIHALLQQQNNRHILKETFDYLAFANGSDWPPGLVRQLVDAMGISLSVLPESIPYKSTYSKSPLEYAGFEGGIAHNSGSSTLVTVTCPGCSKSSMFRIATWEEPSSLLGAMLYRIPNLQYSATLKNGVGLLVKHKRILGRTLYAVPTCRCSILSTVELD